jgi:hypothetical protein
MFLSDRPSQTHRNYYYRKQTSVSLNVASELSMIQSPEHLQKAQSDMPAAGSSGQPWSPTADGSQGARRGALIPPAISCSRPSSSRHHRPARRGIAARCRRTCHVVRKWPLTGTNLSRSVMWRSMEIHGEVAVHLHAAVHLPSMFPSRRPVDLGLVAGSPEGTGGRPTRRPRRRWAGMGERGERGEQLITAAAAGSSRPRSPSPSPPRAPKRTARSPFCS